MIVPVIDNSKILKIVYCSSHIYLIVASNLNVHYACRGGKYSEDDAKAVMVQILNVVAFCHLQGVVHRDLKPEVEQILFFLTP